MAVKTDSALTSTLAANITTPLNKQNTATRVTEIIQDIIDSKLNVDEMGYEKPHNTIFVDSANGSDATGVVENSALPFKTINAAHTASIAHLTATSTDWVTFVLIGYFNEDIAIRNYHNYDINKAYINGTVTDIPYGSAVISRIYGYGTLDNVGNSSIFILYGSTVTINVYSILAKVEVGHASANVDITARVCTTTGTLFANCSAGTLTVRDADVSNTGTYLVSQSVAGLVKFVGCQLGSNYEILKTNSTASNSSAVEFRRCKLYTSGTNKSCVELTTNTGTNVDMLFSNCTFVANGTGACIKVAQATNVRIHGACEANLTYSGAVTLKVGTVANNRFIVSTDVS
jgi:hypothetical protein